MKNRDRFLISTIVGGAVGTAIGFLLAPNAGKKTRKKLLKKGKQLKKKICEEHGDEIQEVTEEVKDRAKSLVDTVKKMLD